MQITKFKKKSSFLALSLALVGSLVLSSCTIPNSNKQSSHSFLDGTSYSNKEVLRISTGNNDPFQPFAFGNPNFNNGSLDDSVLDNAILKLFRYKTSGSWKFDQNNNVVSKPETDLFLEAATGFKIYEKNNNNNNGSEFDSNPDLEYKVDDKNNGLINEKNSDNNRYSEIKKKLSNAYKVEFTINTKIKWYDSETKKEVGHLSPLDFTVGLKLFKLSADLNVQQNGYLLSTLGIDIKKTLEDPANNNKNGQTFTLFLDTNNINTFLFDRFTFAYFAPAPSQNPEIQRLLKINPQNNDDLIKIRNGVIDYSNSRFDDIYGWGIRQKYGAKGWFAGPYLLDSTSNQDIVLTANKDYFQNVKGSGNYKDKIKKIIAYYGNSFSTVESAYQGFITDEIDYVLLNENTKTDAFRRFINKPNELSVIGLGQLARAGDFWWNTDIYDENYKVKKTIDPSYVKFVEKFWTNDAVEVRKGINNLINYPKLASNITFYPGNYDVRFSNVPFGNLSFKDAKTNKDVDIYEAYYKGDQIKVTNPYKNGSNNGSKEEKVDYTGVFSNKFDYFLKDINSKNNQNSYLIKSDPNFNSEQKNFRDALKNLGYSKSSPMNISILFRENPITEATNQLFLKWSEAIKELSDGAIIFKPLVSYTRDVIPIFSDNGFEIAYNAWGLDFRDASNYSTRSIGYFYTNSEGTAKLRKTKNDNDTVQKGLTNFLAIPQLWPKLYDEFEKVVKDGVGLNNSSNDKEKTWQASLFKFLVQNNAFKKKKNGTVQTQADKSSNMVKPSDYNFTDALGDKLADIISSWMVQDTYNSYILNKWIDDQQTLIPLPFNGYYARTWRLSRPYIKPVNPVYKSVKFADWSVDLSK